MAPDTGQIAWNYSGPSSPQLTQLGQRLRVDNTRTTSYSPQLNYIFAGQQDGSIVALDAKTGHPVWTTSVIGAGTYGDVTGAESAPFTQYYDPSGADGIVLSAPNGGGVRSRRRLDAYDAEDGRNLLWRSVNLPDPTLRAPTSSPGATRRRRPTEAADWSISSDRPAVGRRGLRDGKPVSGDGSRARLGPLDREPDDRRLEEPGALKWFFQLTHHDWLDFDVPHPPMILNVPINGKSTRVVAEGEQGRPLLRAERGRTAVRCRTTRSPRLRPMTPPGKASPRTASPRPSRSRTGSVLLHERRRLLASAGLAKCNFPGNPLVDEYSLRAHPRRSR